MPKKKKRRVPQGVVKEVIESADPYFVDFSPNGIRRLVLELRKRGGVLDYLAIPDAFDHLKFQARYSLYLFFDRELNKSQIARQMPNRYVRIGIGVTPPRSNYIFAEAVADLYKAVLVSSDPNDPLAGDQEPEISPE